ncbi:MAG: hypothetical protein M0R17_11010 [Candidatus Omnitrophica bacterium]|jgi:hypothetical protein|nr:hypothetical protein [Candidatus Omnitrophota bacterium]
MAVEALAQIGGGLIKKILGAFAIVVFAVGLYYLVRWIQKGTKKQKAFTIKAVILDMNGVIDFDMLAFVKSEESGMLEMIFKNRKSDSIPPIPKHLVKNNIVLLLNFAPGHYCVIDTSQTIWNFKNEKWEIVPFNLFMKNYIVAKQREFLNKAEAKKFKWEQYAPWITLGIVGVAAVVLTAFLFFIGAKIEAKNIAARSLECLGGLA